MGMWSRLTATIATLLITLAFIAVAQAVQPDEVLADPALEGRARDEYLLPVISGEKTSCFAPTEADAGSDPAAMRTTAVRAGDDYVINGVKRFITGAGDSDVAQVFAVTDPQKRARGGITGFLVDMDTPGVKLAASYDLMVDDKPCEIVFDNVRVPAWKRIGNEGEGFKHAQSWINSGRLRHGARSLGGVAAFRFWPYALESRGESELLPGSRVTPALFGVLGVRPILGRALTDDDARVGAPKVAVIVVGTFFQMVLVLANTTRQTDPALLEAAQTLGAGDLTSQAPEEGGDETAHVAGAFNRMARELAAREFVAGDTYTIADISLFAYVGRSREAELPLDELANVVAWIERVEAQPEFLAEVFPYSIDPHSSRELP